MINSVYYNNLDKYEYDKKYNLDHVATPMWVVESIFNLVHIQDFNSIWFPFDNYDSEFKLIADKLNLNYKATHIFDYLGRDFFITSPPINCDLLISNPPFSIQNDVIKRCFDLVDSHKIKSFCLLLPLSTLETTTRANIYEKYADKLSIIVFKKRIKFKDCNGFFNKACCWVCYNISHLKNTLMWL